MPSPEKTIEKVLNPENFQQSCHSDLPEGQHHLLIKWNNKLESDTTITSVKTRADYLAKTSRFLRYVKTEYDELGIEEVDKHVIRDYVADKSEATSNNYKTTLRQFFLWYYIDYKELRKEDVPRSLDKELKVKRSTGKDKVKKEDIPTTEEVETLLDYCQNHRDRALISILADKGMRIKEALDMNLKHVEFDRAGVVLTVPEAKKDHVSYRSNRLTWSRNALKDWVESHPRKEEDGDVPLFVKIQNRHDDQDFRRLNYSAARKMLERLKDRAGIRDRITLHKFRHYSTTKDRQKDHMRDSFIVKEKGWEDPSMLEKYDHLTDDEVDQAHVRAMVENGQLEPEALQRFADEGSQAYDTIELIKCPNCSEANSPERDLCDNCNQPFNEEGISKQKRLEEAVRDLVDEKDLVSKLDVE